MSKIDQSLIKWRKQLQHVYVVSNEISNLAKDLDSFSASIDLLVSNGTVQASRIASEGSKVFTTLARELSYLPIGIKRVVKQMNIELVELNAHSTKTLNLIRKLSQYMTGFNIICRRHTGYDISNVNVISNGMMFSNAIGIDKTTDLEKKNFDVLCIAYNRNYSEMIQIIHQSLYFIQRLGSNLKELKNTGLMAQYVSLNIASEAVKFDDAAYYTVLSSDINKFMNGFMDKVRDMDNLLEREEKQLRELIRFQVKVSA